MKKRYWWWLGGGLLLVSLCITGFYLYHGIMLMARAAKEPQALVIPVQRLSEYGITVRCLESCTSFRHSPVSASLDIEYEYDNTLQTDEEDLLFISSQAYVELTPLQAGQSYWAYIAGVRLSFLQGDDAMEIEPMAQPLALGDQHYWARLIQDKKPVGEVVVVRQGSIVLAYVISGLFFSTPSDIEDLLRPALAKAVALQES